MEAGRTVILTPGNNVVDLRIAIPSNIVFCGATGAGKSYAIQQCLLNQQHVFQGSFDCVDYCYGVWSDDYTKLQSMFPHGYLRLFDGIPTAMIEDPERFFAGTNQRAVIFDDLALELGGRKDNFIAKLFTKYGRHFRVTTAFVQHNVFEQFRGSKTLSLNTSYYFLFRLARARQQVSMLSQQLFGNSAFLPSVYKQCVGDGSGTNRHGYLVVDNTQSLPSSYHVRTGVLDESESPAFFVPADGNDS